MLNSSRRTQHPGRVGSLTVPSMPTLGTITHLRVFLEEVPAVPWEWLGCQDVPVAVLGPSQAPARGLSSWRCRVRATGRGEVGALYLPGVDPDTYGVTGVDVG